MQTLTHTTTPVSARQPDGAPMQRVRAEYVEMPGLNLTTRQAARLFGVTLGQAEQLLSQMVRERFLERDAEGLYRRRGCRHCWST